jgi:hypothetical protein
LDLLEKYSPLAETLSDDQLELLELKADLWEDVYLLAQRTPKNSQRLSDKFPQNFKTPNQLPVSCPGV